MELSKKTTILFPPDLHGQLVRCAAREGTSLGELVRPACRIQYAATSPENRLRALEELRSMSLPVGSPQEMKRESVPDESEWRHGEPVGRSR